MVAHLAPSVNPPVVAFADLREDRKPCQAAGVVVVDVLTPVATQGYEVQATGNFKTEGTEHNASLSDRKSIFQGLVLYPTLSFSKSIEPPPSLKNRHLVSTELLDMNVPLRG